MPTYANQKRIITHKDKIDGQFGQYPLDALQQACTLLNKGALILWLDFAKNADNYSLDLSPAAIKKAYGSVERTTQRGLEELEEYGYLVKQSNNSYQYDFYLYPQNIRTTKTAPNQKASINTTSAKPAQRTIESPEERIKRLLEMD
jgi:hypothetical protein